ncbi:MAG TPA: acyltransferase [Pyrinomonadaceae bacterium]|nr:acyltransferase [Pyrinomonadaceae bacterium]
MPGQSDSWNGGRLAGIDALRGMAALAVVLFHVVGQAQTNLPHNLLKWPIVFLQQLSSFGYVGVFLFFVISGFCIHLQWAKAQAGGNAYEIKFGQFWKRRFRRLYPAYLVALALYLLVIALTVGIKVTGSFVYDVFMHVVMLHNLDPKTAYSISGVFWTLAIEEQLYLAYFLLLFLRRNWGWGPALICCGAARIAWFFLSHGAWAIWGVSIPIPEAAASHWLTWALGAVSVEAAFGVIKLPRWCSNLWLGAACLVLAGAISQVFPVTDKDGFIHRFCWLVLHPAWGVGFFIVVNRVFEAEKKWRGSLQLPRLIELFAWVGLSSYSLYLTHSFVIMQGWRFTPSHWPTLVSNLLLVTPTTIAFAWIFYHFFEQPFIGQTTHVPTSVTEDSSSPSLFPQILVTQVED